MENASGQGQHNGNDLEALNFRAFEISGARRVGLTSVPKSWQIKKAICRDRIETRDLVINQWSLVAGLMGRWNSVTGPVRIRMPGGVGLEEHPPATRFRRLAASCQAEATDGLQDNIAHS
jgi:hypothetical protein